MPHISIDVDINDILDTMSDAEIQQLVDDLYDGDFVPTKLQSLLNDDEYGILDSDLVKALNHIMSNRVFLTREEAKTIIGIAKKYY
jgi:hypothetical protein